MKTQTKCLSTLLGFIILCGWSVQQTNTIEKAEWLIGTWENKTPGGSIYETWIKTNHKKLSGKSYILKEKDTIVFETIELVQQEGNLFYIPTVKNQNGGLPVRFAARKISENQLIFENKQHDFPQTISYMKTGTNSLLAEISGSKNGKERNQIFSMKRIKNEPLPKKQMY